MKSSKKRNLILLGAIALAAAAGILWIGLQAAPKVNYALHISKLLQPVLDAEHQTMHIAVSAAFDGKPLAVESDVYLVSEDGVSYLAIEQKGTAVYVADQVLFLENGKAFHLGEKLQTQTASFRDLLPQIGALYNILEITAAEEDDRTVYEISVTEDRMNDLLAFASFGENLPVDGLRTMELSLTEQNGVLEEIRFSGNADVEQTSVALNVALSGFRTLESGAYPIPDAVKQSAATVVPEELFSLSEDLYRLVLALAAFADGDSPDGTLALTVDCGLIQLDTQLQLSDLKTSSGRIDPEQLQALPEMLGWLCMEGDINCRQEGTSYVYTLVLDQQGMEQLTRMILPELAEYGSNLTEGSVTVILENREISSMSIAVEGKISAMIVQIPILVQAEFDFA